MDGRELTIEHILSEGVSRVRFAINNLDVGSVQWDRPEIQIDRSRDQFITDLADHGITLTYVLTFWDKEWVAAGGELPDRRFSCVERHRQDPDCSIGWYRREWLEAAD